jgi:hypothetical protein
MRSGLGVGDVSALSRCIQHSGPVAFCTSFVDRRVRPDVGETNRLRSPAIRHIKRRRIMLAVRAQVMRQRVPSARRSATCRLDSCAAWPGDLLLPSKSPGGAHGVLFSNDRSAQTKGFFFVAHERL